MALEQAGGLFDVNKLKARLKERYPEYNFDVPAPLDTKCKSPFYCKDNEIRYTDTEGNLFCGLKYKETDDKDPYKWEWKVCHALIKPVDIQTKHQKDEVELF